ncbi:MAG: lipopolysaccharide core heptose(II) kinase RfaY [Nanoarchaeota archaeon]
MPNKKVRDIRRFTQIIDVLLQGGFGYLVEKIKVKSFSKFKNNNAKEKLPGEVRLRLILEKLGPTFIKFGQILSLRHDLVPKGYAQELGKLQDRVPAFSYDGAKQIIEKELGRPINKLFKSFDKEPIASASVAQVHKAILKSGEVVAVKVQRPNVEQIMDTDIEIMSFIAGLLEKHSPKIKKYKPVMIVEEFKKWTDNELDFRIESQNAKRFYKNFKTDNNVKIPKVYDKYTNKRVLTLEFIDGIELHDLYKVKGKKGFNIRQVMKNGFDAILTQVFIHGFFHADPHPGNIFVLKGNKIALVDFGIVGQFDDYLKEKSIELLMGVVEEDVDSIADTFLDMGLVDETRTNIELFKKDIRKVITPLHKNSLKDVRLCSVLEEVLDIALLHEVKMPLDFVLFGKTLIEVEGIALEYIPDFKLIDETMPFIETLIKKEFNIIDMPKDFMRSLIKFRKFATDLPKETTKALRTIQRGEVKVDIQDTGIKKLSLEIDRSSNRLAYGMVIAALIVAGALTVNVDMAKIFEISAVSFIAFGIAALLGLVLFGSILSEKKLETEEK